MDRRRKDRVTAWHQWATLVGFPLIVAAIIGGWNLLAQIRDDARDSARAVAEIMKVLPRHSTALADHEARLHAIEAREVWR